jgi:hypothetical protein
LSVYGLVEHPPPIANGPNDVSVLPQAARVPPDAEEVVELPVVELPDPDADIGTPPIVTVSDAAPEPVEDEPEPVPALPADVVSAAKAICPTPDTITNPAAIIPDKTTSKLIVVFFIAHSD